MPKGGDLHTHHLRRYGLDYRTLKAIARNALLHSFLDADKTREELQRFDRARADFERSVAGRQTPLQTSPRC
jgi:hypothetical protein